MLKTYHNVILKNEIINDTNLSELGLDDLDETISSIDTRSNLDGNIDNGKSEIKLCDDRKDIGLSLKHDVAYSDKATNTIPCASTVISYQFKPEKSFQAEKTNSSITNCIVSSASIDDNAPGLTFETIQDLGDYKKSVVAKKKRRFSNVNLKELIVPLSTGEWVKMTKSRSKNHFVTSAYSEIVLPKLRELYSGCVPCVRNNYLRKPSEVLKLRKSDEKYYEGYISIYCRHANCCHCDVFGKIEFYSFANKVEGVARFSGKRSHFRRCVKSRPLVGKNRSKIVQKMENERPYSIYRNLQNSLTEEERVYGAHTYAPSQAVLRNLKSQGKFSNRYSDNWIINIEAMIKLSAEKNEPFIRNFSAYPPDIILYTDAQIKTYSEICRKDIIYLDATGSVMKKDSAQKDFQIYTLLVRHPNVGGPSLPVATNITVQHDAGSIRRFLEIFLNDAVKLCGTKTKPIMLMIDGSMAMWNGVLRAFSNETRLDYYMRCWRIVRGKATGKDLKGTMVHNCLSHAMRAAKILVTKHYAKRFRKEAMYWISLIFSSSTLDELKQVVQSVIVLLNCETTSNLVKMHFEHLQEKALLQNSLPPWNKCVSEDQDLVASDDYLATSKVVDDKQELNSPFYCHAKKELNAFISSETFRIHQKQALDKTANENVYCDKAFCERLLRVVVSRVCTTSKIMLGDVRVRSFKAGLVALPDCTEKKRTRCSFVECILIEFQAFTAVI